MTRVDSRTRCARSTHCAPAAHGSQRPTHARTPPDGIYISFSSDGIYSKLDSRNQLASSTSMPRQSRGRLASFSLIPKNHIKSAWRLLPWARPVSMAERPVSCRARCDRRADARRSRAGAMVTGSLWSRQVPGRRVATATAINVSARAISIAVRPVAGERGQCGPRYDRVDSCARCARATR